MNIPRRQGLVAIVAAVVTLVTWAIDATPALAQSAVVVVKGVQTGTVTFGNGTGDVGFGTSSYPAATVTLGQAVDSTKAFIHCTFATSQIVPSAIPTCELSSTTVTITIAATSNIFLPSFTTVRWYVVELEGSVVVQRGVASFTSTQTEPGAALVTLGTAVDCAKSFVLTSARMTSTASTIDEQWTTTATLTGSSGTAPRTACTSGTSSSLELFRNTTGTALTVAWQVIQIEGITVQRGSACIGPTSNPACPLLNTTSGLVQGRSQRVNLGTTVTTSKSWILTTRRAGSSSGGRDGIYAALTDFSCDGSTESGSCLRFDRGAADTNANRQLNITYEVVSFNDTTTSIGRVERKNGYVATVFTTGSATTNITSNTNFSSNVSQGRAVPFFSHFNDRVSNTGDLNSVSLNVKINQTNLTFDRPSGGTRTETIGWQVVEFFGCDTDPTLCHVSASALSGTTASSASVRISWWPIYYANGTQCFVAGTSSTTPLGPPTCNVLVVRAVGATPISFTPSNGTNYTVGNFTGGGGCTAAQGTAGNPCVVHNGTATSSAVTQAVTESGLTNDGATTYNYKVYVKDRATSPNYTTLSDSLSQVSVTPKQRSASGGMQWVYHASGGAALNSPIEDFDRRVYANSSNHKFLTIDSSTGIELADPITTPGSGKGYPSWWPPAPPLSTGAQVAVGDDKGYVTSFDGTTGKRLWTRRVHTDPTDSTKGDVEAAVVVQGQRYSDTTFQNTYNSATYGNYTGDVIFVATRNINNGTQNQANRVYALRASDGTSLWTFAPNTDSTNCNPLKSMDIVPATPFVDYYRNRLYLTTEDGPTGGQNSLWVLSTLGPAASGPADATCRGMLVATVGSLLDNDNTLWESYDASTYYFQSSNGLLRAYDTTTNLGRIGDSTVITNVVPGSPGFLLKSSVWQDYNKYYYSSQTRLYFVTQDGGVWCVDDLGNDFALCSEWTSSNPVYLNPAATGGPTPVAAGMLLEPHFWVGGGDNLGDHAGRGTLFQISTADGSLEKTFVVDSSSTLGDLSTSVAADALYVGTSAGRLYRINLSGYYGSLP